MDGKAFVCENVREHFHCIAQKFVKFSQEKRLFFFVVFLRAFSMLEWREKRVFNVYTHQHRT